MAAAEKVTPIRPAPDGSKPVALQYWYLPSGDYLGVSTDRCLEVGKAFRDGSKIQGLVQSIVLYPNGYIIAEVRCGWQPAVLDKDQVFRTEYYVVGPGGHGPVKPEDAKP